MVTAVGNYYFRLLDGSCFRVAQIGAIIQLVYFLSYFSNLGCKGDANHLPFGTNI